MASLTEIRQQYPQYNDMSDHELAAALRDKFYSDIPEAEYYKSLGLTREDRSQWGPLEIINNVVNQVGTGAYKGIAGVAALPRVLSDLTADRSTKPRRPVAGRAIPGAAEYVQSTIDPTQPQNPGQSLPGYEDILGYMSGIGIPLVTPETRTDKFLQAGGTGATGAFFPGGVLPNTVGGVVGSLASEVGGQLTEGTKAEPYARILPAIFGGFAGSKLANKAVASNVEQLIDRATSGVTPQQWEAAVALQAEAAARGTPITSAEAIAQVTGGNRSLMSIQRTVEQMPQTERAMGQFMANRPQGNAAAVGTQLDDIAARPSAPFEVGPRVQTAAQQSVEGLRKQINALTDDAYRWGTDQLIPPAEFAPIADDPIFQHFANIVRNDPILGKKVAGLEENSVAFVNAVKKEMNESAENFSNYTSQTKSPERSMVLGETQAPMVDAAKRASPLYEQALEQQALLRQTQLEPMKRGATGQLANTDDWQAQAKIILSDTPGAEKEVAAAVKNVVARDPDALPELLRMKLEDTFNKALPNAKGVNEQYRGANFAGLLEKNPQQMKSLEAAVKALPNGETQWQGLKNLIRVFEAQGQRLLPGSPTSFNQQLAGQLERNIGKGVTSFGTDLWANWNVERRSRELARILTAPEGVALLRQLAVLGPNTARAQQLVQAFYQGGQAAKPSEEPVIDIYRTLGLPQPAPQ
jgi:hypothetical protein